MTESSVEHVFWVAVDELGRTHGSSKGPERAVAVHRLRHGGCEVLRVHRCRVVLPVETVETIEGTAEKVEPWSNG